MMNHGARILLVSGVATFMAGCADGSSGQQHGESALAKELAGTWNITFHLERPPSLVMDTVSVKHDVSGSLAFLANRSLENHYPGVDTLTNYGTYDIDFTAFGFDPRDGGRIPTVVVGSIAEDSIEMVLSPDQEGISVRMRGGISGDSVSGKWDVSFPRAGAGGGSFFMKPRRTRRF
jgi:hypothetical protein